MKKLAQFRFIPSILWVGFLLAISFMEAPLKFQAELVTLPVGLSIGKVIFTTLNKIEWVLLALIIGGELTGRFNMSSFAWAATLLVIVGIQSSWLLPELNDRASAIIGGALLPHSNIHFYYVAFEVLKLTALVLYTRQVLRNFNMEVVPLKTAPA